MNEEPFIGEDIAPPPPEVLDDPDKLRLRLSRLRIQKLISRKQELRRAATHTTVMFVVAWVMAMQCGLYAWQGRPMWWVVAAALAAAGTWLARVSVARRRKADAMKIAPAAPNPDIEPFTFEPPPQDP